MDSFLVVSRKIVLFVCLVTLCYGCKANSENYPVLFKSSSKLIAPYGMCTHISRKGIQWEYDSKEKELSLIKYLDVNFVRTDFDWSGCQRQKDNPISFVQHDEMMNTVMKYRLQMLGIISSPETGHYDKWKDYVKALSKNYKSNVNYWEMINEADKWPYRNFDFTSHDYVRFLRDAYPLIKKENKNAKVLFTSISDLEESFFEEVLSAGVSDCFDIMNLHFYVNSKTEPEYLFTYFDKVENILKKYKIRKPVWFTETGCTTAEGYADEITQANRLPRVFLIAFACGIEKVFWYKSRAAERSDHYEEHFGLWHNDYQPKPAFFAYQTLVQMCPPKSTRPTISRKGNVYKAVWKQPSGKYVTALWTSKGSVRLKDVSFSGSSYDLNGENVSLKGGQIDVTPSILYFVGDKRLNF